MTGGRALVIGASQGLGAHFARRLAEDGWKVTGLGRRLAERVPGELDYIQADLAAPAAVTEVLARIGPTPELIVHNAVVYPGQGPHALPDLESVFRANTLAPYLLLSELLAARPPEQPCACVVVNSDSIFHARAQSGVYAASKAALRVLTTTMADRFRGSGASVSTLLLGPIADPKKVADLRRVAEQRGVDEQAITRTFLGRSNTDLVIDELIGFEPCYQALATLAGLGKAGNGAVFRVDGGSGGSLV
ncbi:short-subunit dehydrogenase [Amycolatopsis sulphurea]|uniref:Short-subunit dehydrogenase n=1 Tax=Amycolatopsis sulphurea TaxID=76022 RepID=A0A2A9FGX1_9PSEU|nr:SDR family oxidoreductase [Amycolatopsis sulphurea]PFG49685.1 short-subunit dehydrogenase [Amycolatopsis sulphurea]